MVETSAVEEETTSEGPSGRIFPTAGPQFWALLSAILLKTGPESLLELGGGRSTTFLADYAARFDKPCISFEQSGEWHQKVSADLRCMGIEREIVHYVPLEGATHPRWYRFPEARRLIGERPWDFVFVDGPQHRARRNAEGQELVRHAAREARLIIVDDVHRDYNLRFFLDLSGRFPPEGRFFYSYGVNRLGMAAGDWAPIIRACFTFLEVPFTSDTVVLTKPQRGERRMVRKETAGRSAGDLVATPGSLGLAKS